MRFVTLEEAARQTGFTKYFLYKSIHEGSIPFLKHGNRYYLDVGEVHQALLHRSWEAQRRARANWERRAGWRRMP